MVTKLSSKHKIKTIHLADIIAEEMNQVYKFTQNTPIADIFQSQEEANRTVPHIVRAVAWLKYGCTYSVIAEAEKKASGLELSKADIGNSINSYMRSIKHEHPAVSEWILELYP